MTVDQETTAQRIAKFVTQVEYQDLPSQVIQKVKELLLDQLGAQFIGSTLSWNKIAYDFIAGFHGPAEATIVNYGTKALVHDAAFVNGIFGQGSELDDFFAVGGGTHPGALSIPVAMALGERKHMDGRAFLTSIVTGYDIAYHLGIAMMPDILHLGFHPQIVIGVFSAAAVAGKLFKLDAEEMTNALAIAGSHASGTLEYDQSGGEVKRLHTGLAVRGGIQSAMLAKMGLTGPRTIFEGKRGILRLFSQKCNPEVITQNLGQDFGVMQVAFKQYPVVAQLQSSVDVLARVIRQSGIKADDVKRIDVGLNEDTLLHGAAIYEPYDTISAQFSLAFSLAIRLLKGSNNLALYMDPRLWRDPQVLELGRKVHPYGVSEAQGDKRLSSRIKVTLLNGKTVEGQLDYPKGSPKNPMTKEERLEKFRKLASSVLSVDRIEEVIRTVDRVEQLGDVASLASVLVR